jgi:hypothetical protein
MGQRDQHLFEKILDPAYRYDKIYCDLLDQGLTPGEAAEKAAVMVQEPMTWKAG